MNHEIRKKIFVNMEEESVSDVELEGEEVPIKVCIQNKEDDEATSAYDRNISLAEKKKNELRSPLSMQTPVMIKK